jgi:hypothetical protein
MLLPMLPMEKPQLKLAPQQQAQLLRRNPSVIVMECIDAIDAIDYLANPN